jgi:hypothetical protein
VNEIGLAALTLASVPPYTLGFIIGWIAATPPVKWVLAAFEAGYRRGIMR